MPRGHGLFVDEDVRVDDTYRYRVTGANLNGQSEVCGEVEVTAVPFFGGPVIAAFGLVACLGAYLALRRRP